MKKLALAFAFTLFLTACSSGTSVSESPINLSGKYTGTFQNQDDTDKGTVIIDLVENSAGEFSGIAQFIDSVCLNNGTVSSGTTSGFSVNLVVNQDGGGITLQLNSNNKGRLNGTYLASGDCSNGTGAGSISLSRG